MNYTSPLAESISFSIAAKVSPTKGNMAWEYNPFRNYRLSEAKYYFRNKFLNIKELFEELGTDMKEFITATGGELPEGEDTDPGYKDKLAEEIKKILQNKKSWDIFKVDIKGGPKKDPKYDCVKNPILTTETIPEFYDKGQLIDFDTSELSFDVNHPIDILPQWSYDGSVNLIINDGKNKPRLINSRFSPLGRNKYQVVDRKGNNDTNIYDEGNQFETDTSLYKTYVGIPTIEFVNVFSGGNLPIGNYHFYFRYTDADGNETDFVGESGLVSIFKGTSLGSITSGFREENSYKSVKFILSDIDPAYSYVNVYYTKNTSDINENATTTAYKIDSKFLVNNASICQIYITGNEPKTEITVEEINPQYQIAENVQTQAACQNMLFFGNIQDETFEYEELADLSLRFTASSDTESYTGCDHNYNSSVSNTYSDPLYIYNTTGYQNHEIYRFGIVYLFKTGTLSPVFNIRGMWEQEGCKGDYSKFDIFKKDSNTDRNYIAYNEETGIVYKDTASNTKSSESFENVFGVLRIHHDLSELENVTNIKITIDKGESGNEDSVLFEQLKKYNVKGYFFVRQKRIPLRLCQAYTIGVDGESNTPVLYVENGTNLAATKPTGDFYIAERFLSNDKRLVHGIENRLYPIEKSKIYRYGAICPDYDINSPYYNTLFCGDEYVVETETDQKPLTQDSSEYRHFYQDTTTKNTTPSTYVTRILGVEDNVKLVEIKGKLFSARAGEAEEAFRYEFIGSENKSTNATNLIRGSFGPYLAFDGFNQSGQLVNIYIKDYLTMDKQTLFKIRYADKSPYYAISERFDINADFDEAKKCYRGDTYICTFTHRFNRNFQDPSAPTNSKIVDEDCWKDNFEYEDGILKKDNFDKINLGDVNAVKIGMWVTFRVVSSNNLNIRGLDDSISDEVASMGHGRTFYPYSGMTADGSYKTPEALVYNKGFSKGLSERHNFENPDVPAVKNDFTNRIAYSDIHVNDAFKNGFRTFQGTHYRDYPKTYGQITKLVELRGSLLCVFEHGIALIPVNERAIAGEGNGGSIYINTSNVLPENPKVISDTFGSQWKDSIIKTPSGVYGVDTIGKKIWRTNGDTFECISDFKVQEFLNQNITLGEREIDPYIGVRNVKTHYNKFKHDVMFTFYDNLEGFEEKAWNLCYSEVLQKWATFYSWIPSYSENIYNQYFSFDRNTSKWITKLGVSKDKNSFSDGVVLDNNIFNNDLKAKGKIGELNFVNRNLPTGEGITVDVEYSIEHDNFGNYNRFYLDKEDGKWYLFLRQNAVAYCSELYERKIAAEYNSAKDEYSYDYIDNLTDKDQLSKWSEALLNSTLCKVYDDSGVQKQLKTDPECRRNPSTIVYLLNIKAKVTVNYPSDVNIEELYNGSAFNGGTYSSVIAVMPKYNMQFLTTNFWKHGQAGIIDVQDEIKPTYWYGKQHPFEFEFVVCDNPQAHKIFDNLEIISNNAEPESFHYEIVGDSYDFAKDKKNMYIRQEATKELYQYNGSDIVYDTEYSTLNSEQRKNYKMVNGQKVELDSYDKSTLMPLYYSRVDTVNEVEDYYKSKTSAGKNYNALAGGEIIRNKTLDEYRIWNHAKAIDITDPEEGRLRGNMQYKEDKWYVQINPLNIVQKNESKWGTEDITGVGGSLSNDEIPIELGQSPIPDEVKESIKRDTQIPPNSEHRAIVKWGWNESQNKEVKIKDKWVKIRVRYTGNKLAIISAVSTLYSISYS